MRGIHALPILAACVLFGAPALAQQNEADEADTEEAPCAGCAVEIQSLLEQVAANSGRKFLLETRVPLTIDVRGTGLDDPDYPVLLSILRANGLAAAEIEGYVHIIPDAAIRQMPLPIVQRDDPDIADDEWVVRVISVSGVANADRLVPILRPLIAQMGHLSSAGDDSTPHLIVVARYAKVRQITEIVKLLTQ